MPCIAGDRAHPPAGKPPERAMGRRPLAPCPAHLSPVGAALAGRRTLLLMLPCQRRVPRPRSIRTLRAARFDAAKSQCVHDRLEALSLPLLVVSMLNHLHAPPPFARPQRLAKRGREP